MVEINMNKLEFSQARRALDEISILLNDDALEGEERERLEQSADQLAGLLMRQLLPIGFIRRALMVLFFVAGIYGIVIGNYYLLGLWIIAGAFSPRITAEALRIINK